jgi:hypothetical protein
MVWDPSSWQLMGSGQNPNARIETVVGAAIRNDTVAEVSLLSNCKVSLHECVSCIVADDGSDIQQTLTTITGSRTVPQVFIDGKFIGGCDGKFYVGPHSYPLCLFHLTMTILHQLHMWICGRLATLLPPHHLPSGTKWLFGV